MRNDIPTLASLQQYDVNRRNEYEGIRQSLYDFGTYAAAGQTSLQFFQIPQGQGGKTLDDTNMTSAGQLPQPQHFLVESIELYFYPTAVPGTAAAIGTTNFINDVYTVGNSGNLDFFIGSKTYLQEAPLNRFPPKVRLDGENSVAMVDSDETGGLQQTFDYAVWAGRPYFMQPPILLVPNQNFSITLRWNTAIALPSTQTARIGIVLDGILYRQSQ